MNYRIILQTVFVIILILSCSNNSKPPDDNCSLVERIELESKDYNIELYICKRELSLESDKEYGNNCYKLYKAYENNTFDSLYARDTNYLDLNFIKINDDSLLLIEKRSIAMFHAKCDTLINGKHAEHYSIEITGYEYDTLLVSDL